MITAFVMEREGFPTIQHSLRTGSASPFFSMISGCSYVLLVSGTPQSVSNGVSNFGGIAVLRSGSQLTFLYPDGMRLFARWSRSSVYGCFMQLFQMQIPGTVIRSAEISGLFGSPNGSGPDDVADQSGNPLSISSYSAYTSYCETVWGISQLVDSKFVYSNVGGDSFLGYQRFGQCGPSSRPILQNLPGVLLEVARRNPTCVIDGLIAGGDGINECAEGLEISRRIGAVPGITPGPGPSNAPVVRFLDMVNEEGSSSGEFSSGFGLFNA